MACLGLGAGLVSVYGFFVEPLAREFGVGAALLNIGPVALLLVPGVAAPFIGRLADRVPIRNLVLAGATLAMGALLATSRAPTLALAGLGFVVFALGFCCYGPVVVNGLMVKFYPGREARALAIAAIGISLATAVLPPLTGLLLAAFGWRTALALLAGGLLALLWLVVLWGMPGGIVGAPAQERHRVAAAIYRQRPFWLIGFCVALALNASVVLAVSFPPHFANEGYSVAQAGGFLSFAGIAGFVGKACIAWLGDAGRQRAHWLAAAVLGFQVAGFLALLAATDITGVLVAMALVGFGSGAFLPMQAYLNSRYFDAGVIGEVSGAQMPLFLPFALVAAPLAGYVFDRIGSYDPVIAALAAVLALAALLALLLPPASR